MISSHPVFREEVLYHSDRARVLRRQLDGTASTVIVKELLGADAATRMHREVRILERLSDVEGVSKVAAVDPRCNAIMLEDVHGERLERILRTERLDVRSQILLMLRLAQIVAAVHRRGIVHKGIGPLHIMLSGPERKPTLLHFELAASSAEPSSAFVSPDSIAGTLAYLAPELTGRTGRTIDHRADLYALGVLFYEMSAGRLPFAHADPLWLIHDILARVPARPIDCDPLLPQALSDMVMRLLEKEPDRRYQSADGLAHDLARLRDALECGESASFPLGENDFALQLRAPSRLIGREAEIDALRGAFETSLQSGVHGVLIRGARGVGKTALLNELRSVVTARRGWFVAGKYDPQRLDRAADAIYQSLRALGGLLLTEPEAELAALRTQILRALGDAKAGEVAALLPEFAVLLAVTPVVVARDMQEGVKHMRQAVLEVLRAIASPARPIVMVLDDLQWASSTPLSFIDVILRDEGLRGLLLVGAFREADLEATHPLAAMLPLWERLSPPPLQLRLENLPPAQLALLLEEMLRLPPSQAALLAQTLAERTDGNPHDTVELINTLRHDGVLVPGNGGWSWDAAAIRRYVGGSDVTELLAARVDRLPPDARAVLQLMACLGGELEFSVVQAASGLSGPALDEQLAPGLEDELLILDQDAQGTVRFRHNLTQQIVYDRLELAARQHLHLTAARRLMQHPQYEALAAEQYLQVPEALHDASERREVAELLRRTAAASRLVNGVVAERFLAAALAILHPIVEPRDALLRRAVEVERHALLCGLGRLDEADALYNEISRNCDDPQELSGAACLQLSGLSNRGRHREALELGFALLAQFGFERPGEDLVGDLERRLQDLYEWLANLDLVAELRRDPVTDPRLLTATEVRLRLVSPALFSDPTLAFWLLLESQRQWAEDGPFAAFISHLSFIPRVFIALRGDYRTAYALQKKVMAVGAGHIHGHEMFRSRMAALFVEHWVESLADDVEKCDRLRRDLVEGGYSQFASFTHHVSLAALFECAPTLDACAVDLDAALGLASRSGDEHSGAVFATFRQLLQTLRRGPDASEERAEHDVDAGQDRASLAANPMAAAFLHVNCALAAAIFTGTSEDPADLARHAAAAVPLLRYIEGHYHVGLGHFVQALALAARARTASSDERAALLAELAVCRDWLARRAEDAPENFLDLLREVDAEQAWAAGDFQTAMAAFDGALRQVRQHKRPWHIAFTTERAAVFHLSHGLEYTGRKLLREARQCYETWGASEKVRDLDQSHAFLRTDESTPANSLIRESGVVSSDAIDMLAILRTSQALSSETSLDKLKTHVVELLGAMTGAARIVFVAYSDDPVGWFLPVTADTDSEVISVDEAGARGMLPLSAFRYAERTREPLLLEDATRDDRFARDPYLAGLGRCSLLIAPIFSHGLPRAVLLLENQSASGAFSADRLDAVMLIAGQLGVSLDNARRYELLERNVAERTAELANSLALIRATLESTSDALFVTDSEGRITTFNELYLRQWGFAREMLVRCQGREAFEFIRSQLKDPEQVLARVEQMVAHPDEDGFGVVELKDGRVFEERSRPHRIGERVVGRVWSLHDITERRRAEAELQTAHAQLLEASRQGGMAEVATNVLHNVGNVLNSVNVSATVVADSLRKSKVVGLGRLVGLLREHEHDLGTFISSDPRGRQLPLYLAQLAEHLQADQQASLKELDLLRSHIEHIREIVTMQQTYAKVSAIKELVRVSDLVEDSLRLNLGALTRHGVELVREFQDLPPLRLEKHKVLQILVNLISNAKYACDDVPGDDKRLILRVGTRSETGRVYIAVNDNGVGIPKENLTRIFNHGFTTRASGHGFGLHGSALAAREMGGSLTVHSDGPGTGATFTLELPLQTESESVAA
jgi:PAS domain S-box-containing protein